MVLRETVFLSESPLRPLKRPLKVCTSDFHALGFSSYSQHRYVVCVLTAVAEVPNLRI